MGIWGLKDGTLNPPTPSKKRLHPPQITSYLNRLASDLEAAAYPALDSLTNRVTAHNLERVRRIKGRLVRLSTRVETVRRPGWGAWGVFAGGGRGGGGGGCRRVALDGAVPGAFTTSQGILAPT
jgi:hypothetical protein